MGDLETRKGFWSSLWGFAALAIAVVLVWLVAFFVLPTLYGKPNDVGVAGDMFGGVTALFSGLAFAGLISTLLMQRQELELQRRELELSREEFKLQRFENTLFGLIKMFNEHVASMSETRNLTFSSSVVPKTLSGREYIESKARRFPTEIKEIAVKDSLGNNMPPQMERIPFGEQLADFRKYFDSYLEPDFAPYMRLLYGVFRHIDTAKISEDRKKMYSRIARSHLSSSEIKLLFFDCATDVGKDFRPWIEKYGLLKHLPNSVREYNPSLMASYSPSAFEPSPIPHTPM